MRVLLKPNLLAATDLAQAVTTHPVVVGAVVELVQEAGGRVLIGDSPAGPIKKNPGVWHKGGMVEVAERTGARLVPFDEVTWKRVRGNDYFIARPVFEADLVINLPKFKTHALTLFTGAVKNLFGTIPGTRKREVHCRAPGVKDFGQTLVDVLELVQPGLSIMDGILGQEGNGPGVGGTARRYGCLAASPDPVALDTVIAGAIGCRPGEVLHLAQAHARGLGVSARETIRVEGNGRALDFGAVDLPKAGRFLRLPSWVGTLLGKAIEFRPQLDAAECAGCGQCIEVCPAAAVKAGKPPAFDLDECIGCFCCAEICPRGAITPHRGRLAQIFGIRT
jgi:uncharacterized protein (DUF362 family)/Pyruvate/2-oxoacid:ferredoxin oxidoreductase delta subunit